MFHLSRRITTLALAGVLAVSSASGLALSAFADEAELDEEVVAVVELDEDTLALIEQIEADPEGTHIVVDTKGNEVEIPNTITSIVVPFPAATQGILGLGGADLLTGCYILSTDMNQIMFGDYIDAVTLVRPSDLNVEVVLNCDPDFAVLVSDSQAAALADTDIPVLRYSVNDYEDLKANVQMMAEAIGTQEALEKAAAYAAFYDELVETVTEMTADVADEDRPKVFVCVKDDGLSTWGADSLVSEWVYMSGGISISDVLGVEDDTDVTLTAEQIVEADPDIIICTTVEGYEAIMSNPAFENLTAVVNGEVYINPLGGSVWFKAHFEAPLELTWAPTIISPDLCEELDTRAYVEEFYLTFYGYEITDEDYELIMNPTVGSE